MKVGTKRRLSFRIGLCAALVSGVVVAGGPAALADCAETVWVETYEVQVEAERDVYRAGETARLDATVVHQDTRAPIEGATFVAYVSNLKKGWLYGFGKTDADGHTSARLKLRKKSVRPGPVEVRSIAYKMSVDATCAQLVEFGERTLKRAFVVKP